MEPILAVAFVGGGVALVGWLAVRQHRRRLALMLEVVQRRGGVVIGAGWTKNPGVRIVVDGIEVVAYVWSTKHAQGTVWTATLPPPGGVVFKVSPQGVVATIAKALGGQDVVLGADYEFDERFVVKTADGAATRRVWSLAVTHTLVASFAHSTVECDGDSVVLAHPAIGDAANIEAGLDLVVGLARSDPFGLVALRAIEGARYHHDAREPCVVLEGPGDIRIGPSRREPVAVTVARGVASGAATIDIAVRDGAPTVPAAVQSLPGAALTLLRQLGTADVIGNQQELAVRWHGIETERARLEAAVALLRELARAPAMGAYR